MLFTSWTFGAFLAVTFAVYYLISAGGKQLGWLVLCSLFFYGYENPPLLILLLIVAAVDIFVTRKILVSPHPRFWAMLGVGINVGALAFFKYNHLIGATFPTIAASSSGVVRTLLSLPLPIGISFYTLHGVSLLLDTFREGAARRDVSHAKSLLEHSQNTLLYLAFFPQLIAGPITKAHQFYPQIGGKHFREIDWEGAASSLLMGYFLKSVIADNLSQQTFWLTYPYFLNFSSIDLLVLLFGYSMQIFADFAGYSLIAIGLAKLFGYDLPTNFLFPYISQSFSEFWTRWHISLSSWMREYLYVPLGGNREGTVRTWLNLLTVMVIGGMWHGAAWSYGVWGLWHGFALVSERLIAGRHREASPSPFIAALRIAVVFSVVSVGWLLFKLPHFSDVVAFFHALGANTHVARSRMIELSVALYSIPVLAHHAWYLRERTSQIERRDNGWRRQLGWGLLAASIVLCAGPAKTFIYFQF
jgi:alginate O-acetyltransferase complex protein AlgI